jgi:hypothetical protein
MAGNFILDEQPFPYRPCTGAGHHQLIESCFVFFFFHFFCPVNFYVGYLQ